MRFLALTDNVWLDEKEGFWWLRLTVVARLEGKDAIPNCRARQEGDERVLAAGAAMVDT